MQTLRNFIWILSILLYKYIENKYLIAYLHFLKIKLSQKAFLVSNYLMKSNFKL